MVPEKATARPDVRRATRRAYRRGPAADLLAVAGEERTASSPPPPRCRSSRRRWSRTPTCRWPGRGSRCPPRCSRWRDRAQRQRRPQRGAEDAEEDQQDDREARRLRRLEVLLGQVLHAGPQRLLADEVGCDLAARAVASASRKSTARSASCPGCPRREWTTAMEAPRDCRAVVAAASASRARGRQRWGRRGRSAAPRPCRAPAPGRAPQRGLPLGALEVAEVAGHGLDPSRARRSRRWSGARSGWAAKGKAASRSVDPDPEHEEAPTFELPASWSMAACEASGLSLASHPAGRGSPAGLTCAEDCAGGVCDA